MKAPKKYCYVYMIKNLIDHKCYIGFHTTNNIYDNYKGSGIYLNRAIKKYGRDNFIKGVIEFCTFEEWKEKESYWIKIFNTKHPYGYNLTDGGEGALGKIVSEETKKLMSKTRRERKVAEGENNGMYGRHHSEDSKKQLSKTRIEKEVAKGKNNPTFDHNIYIFYNKQTNETFIGLKSELALQLNSNSSALNALIKGRRPHHKNWIYEGQQYK